MAKEVPAQTEWAIRKDKVHLTFQVIQKINADLSPKNFNLKTLERNFPVAVAPSLFWTWGSIYSANL